MMDKVVESKGLDMDNCEEVESIEMVENTDMRRSCEEEKGGWNYQ